MKRIIYTFTVLVLSVLTASHVKAQCPTNPGSISTSNATLCPGSSPGTIDASAASGGNGALFYVWQRSTNSGSTWIAATGSNNSEDYTPPALVVTTWFRRMTIDFGGCSNTFTSEVRFTVTSSTSITANPSDATICDGDNVNFSISATGASVSYQWQVDEGSGFGDITNGGIYSNATTDELTITGASTGENGYNYRCVASSLACSDQTSNDATLTVLEAPVVTTNPNNSTICESNNTTFGVTATGDNITYQWQVDDGLGFSNLSDAGVYSGTSTNTLSITSATTGMHGYDYRCEVDNSACNAVQSTSANLNVSATPDVTSNPSNVTACVNDDPTFSVSANGDNLTYQWQVDDGTGFSNLTNTGVYSNVTAATMNITDATSAMDGFEYRCVVDNAACAEDISTAATLTVQIAPSITSQPSASTTCEDDNATFTVTATGTTVTYQWQEDDGTGFANITNGGSYSGATTTTLSISSVGLAIDGYDYRVVVTNTGCGSTTSNQANLDVVDKPEVTANPSNTTVCVDDDPSFSVTATGDALTYQWQVDDGTGFSNLSNAGVYSNVTTPTLNITDATAAMNDYDFRCEVDNASCNPVNSNAAALTVQSPPNITGQPSTTTVCINDDPTFSVTAAGAGLTYQWQVNTGSGFSNLANAGVYSNVTTATLQITDATAAMDGYQYLCIVSGTCNPSETSNSATLNIDIAPTVTASPTSATVCVDDDPTFGVTATGDGLTYQWQVDDGGGFANLSNAGVYSDVTTSTLQITDATAAMSGYDYRCVVSGNCTPSATSASASLTVQVAPAFTTSPTSTTYCAGNDVDLNVAVTGTSPSLQWQVDAGSGFSNLSNDATYSGVTTNTLTISSAAAGLSGNDYRVVASNAGCGTVNSSAATITNSGAPAVTANPSNTSACAGNNASFSVTASGSNLTYQWQEDQGGGFSDLANGGVYSNVTSATMNITGATTGMNGYDYRVVVSSVSCPSATSTSAELTINTAPSIGTQPTDLTTCDGDNISISVAATGTSLTYQWQEDQGSGYSDITNGGAYSGATTNSLSISAITTSFDTYSYRVVVGGTCTPTQTSNEATVTVESQVSISSSPSSQTVCVNDDPTFSVSASGGTVSYQWQVDNGGGSFANLSNGGIYSNVTTATMQITNATAGEDGYIYRCLVTSSCGGPATSGTATLNVDVAPSVTANPGDLTRCVTDAANFSVTAGIGTNLDYQWQEDDGSGFSDITNGGIYSGATNTSLTLSSVTAGMNGYDYRCVVSNTGCGSTNSAAATLTVNQAPSITTNSSDVETCDGDNASFSITASGASLTYQWQENTGTGYTAVSNGGIYSGVTTNTLTLTGVTTSMDANIYRCVVSGTCNPSQTSANRELTVLAEPNVTTNPSNSTICDGSNTSFTVAATGDALTYQWQVEDGSGYADITNGGVYGGATSTTLSLTNPGTGLDGYKYRCVVDNSACNADISNEATLEVQATPTVTVDPSDVTICENTNTSFGVTATGSSLTYQWQLDAGSGYTNVANGGVYSGATTATLSLTSPATGLSGNDYRCVVDNSACSEDISALATLTVQEAPAVTTSPSGVTICENTNTSFSVTATGSSLTYQWQLDAGSGYSDITNGGVYSGATTATLSLTSAGTGLDGNDYRCVVDNSACSAVNSSAATLAVQGAPTVTVDPSDVTICENTNTSFGVTATGSSLTYQWQLDAGSGYSDISNGGVYSGATTATLSLTNSGTGLSGNDYRCVVDNSACSEDISALATLTVQEAPAVTTSPSGVTICENTNTSFSVTATGSSLTYQWQLDAGSGYSDITNGGVYSGATTPTLSLTSAGTGLDGNDYRCVVDNSACSAVNSSAATLAVQGAPTVTVDPSDVTVCETSNTSFSVTATGSALVYQWQLDAGSGFADISNGGIYSGATTNTLSLSSAGTGLSGNDYRCVVDNASCTADTSTVATLTVQAGPSITSSPSASTICSGSNTTFAVTATGTAISYQWQVDDGTGYADLSNGGFYSNVDNSTLTITGATTALDGNDYRVSISNSQCSGATSTGANLTVSGAPTVTVDPTDETICENSNTSFSVTATGSALVYQWQVDDGTGFADLSNGGVYSGATTNTLSLTSAGSGLDGNDYRCVVDNVSCTEDISAVATLTIQVGPAVTSNPQDSTICNGNNATFTVAATGTAITYQWQVDDGTGYTDLGNGGVYSNVDQSTLTITGASTAISGYEYRAFISNTQCTGVNSTGATLTVQGVPTVTVDPTDETICENSNTSFSVTATGSALVYQWQVDEGTGFADVSNGGVYGGATTNTLSLTSAGTGLDGYDYRCVVDNSTCTEDISAIATLTVQVGPSVTTNPSASTICSGTNTSFSVSATGTALAYQWQVDDGTGYTDLGNGGVYSNVDQATLTITGATAAIDGNDYRVSISNTQCTGVNSTGATLTVQGVPTVTVDPTDETICENSNTSFGVTATGSALVYQWQVDDGTGFANLSSGGVYSGATTNTLSLTSAGSGLDGYDYRCVVDNSTCTEDISAIATLTVQVGPAVTSNPQDSTICNGNNATFTVAATGTAITYQWQVDDGTGFSDLSNGGVYSTVDQSTLTITSASTALDGYEYRAVISNTQCTDITSTAATFTVQTAPSITTAPINTTVCDGNNATFTVAAAGSAITYQWQVDEGTGFADITNNTTYGGATSTTLSITGASLAMDAYDYRCVVENQSCNPAISAAATLSIDALPSVTSNPTSSTVCTGDNSSFSVSATGAGLTYQWQVDEGIGFADISNGGIYSNATTQTLGLSNLTATQDGYDYRCVVSGNCTPDQTSNTASLTVQTPASVTTSPSDVAICAGTNTSFTVAATGSALTYQWQVDAGSGFANITNGGIYSGATSTTLSITGVTSTLDGFDYRVEVDNSACTSTQSASADLSILPQPTITLDPSASTICEGENTSFTVAATGDGLSLQWQVDEGSGFTAITNGGIYSGATSTTLNLSNVSAANNGFEYRCVASGTCSPDDISNAVTLTVDVAPVITTEPRDTSLCENETAEFSVAAVGTSISYQWQVWNGFAFADITNGGDYSGATSTDLSIANITPSLDTTYYRVVLSGANCPSDTSDTVMLDVKRFSTKPHPSATVYSFCDGGSTDLSADFGIAGDNSTIEWYTEANGTGTNFASGNGPITVSPNDTTTYYLRREGECNTTADTSITIFVQPKPTADFSVTDACEGLATRMSDSSSVLRDSIVKYEWNLGDASTSNLKNVAHTYSRTGTYDIQLVVTTQGNCTDTITKSTEIFEQPTADFSISSVCLNDLSEFSNSSSIKGTATLSYDWDFGDGTGTSTLNNPEYQYQSTGGYTIELKATSSDGCIDSVSKSTTIYMLPTADFDFANACLGDDVDFTNKSKISSGTLTYEWDFADGNTSTATSPTNGYSTASTYDVELVATSNNGCTDTLTQEVETYELPTADFNFASACEGDLVSFSDNSTSPTGSNLSYSWDFDNGSSSNNSSPQVRYTASGAYDVTLTVESAEGCTDDVTKSVDVYGAPNISLAANKVCEGFATSFTNSSTSTDASSLSYLWRFGDGDTSLRVAPSHSYAAAGTYTTTLVVTSGNGCVDSASIPVTVWVNPVANFRTGNVCLVDSAEFFDVSSIASGSYSSLWKFGDNTTSTKKSPKHLYAADGTYRARLIVTSTNGCQDSITQTISIYPMPEPDFTFNNQCDGNEVDFVNQTAVSTGTQYQWAFGDGFGSAAENPSHTYQSSGTYNATLTATTANGCKQTTAAQTVTIHPRVNLAFNTANVCDNDSVTFINSSFLSAGTAQYAWNFGDGNGVVGQTDAVHLYDTFGVYGVTLYGTTDQNCVDSVKGLVEVYAQPIADYSVASDCEGNFSDFQNATVIPSGIRVNYIWDFADGFSSNLGSPKHQYSTFGTYTTELVAITSDGCIDTANQTHNVWAVPEADFRTFGTTTNEVSELCIYETVNFTDVSTIDAGNIIDWTWNFGDATSQSGLRNVQKNYILAGVYEIELMVESDSGCTDIVTQKIEMLPKPSVDFTFRDTCEGFGVEFANQSTVAKGQMSYTWDFGDNNKSTLREPTHTYMAAGNYDVTLIGVSTDGCLDTAGPKNIIIHEIPDATISSNIGAFEFCEGDSAILSVPDVAGYSYLWSTGETTNEIIVRTGGVFEVTITSAFGCTNTSRELITVWTRPTAVTSPDVTISKGYSTELQGSGGLFFYWSPGETLDDSLKQNPTATPLDDETYQLVVEDGNGCLDTASVNVTVVEDYRLEPSEVFTPNGDGINDVWVIGNITTYPDCEIIITNRWQQVLYTQDNYDNTWDGTFNSNSLTTGAYNYIIKCGNGRVYTGTVNILR